MTRLPFKSRYLIWLAILALAIFLRLFRLGFSPERPTIDEMSLAYNAYSLLETGKDEWGKPYPLIFRAFGDYKLPAYIYASLPFIHFFGLNLIGIRLVSVISGVLSVFLIARIGYQVTRRQSVALLSALIMAISPWTVHISRMALESNLGLTLFLIGLTFLLDSLYSSKKSLPLISGLFFGLTAYAYIAFRLILFFLILICFIAFLRRTFNRRTLTLWFISLFLTLVPLIPFWLDFSGQARLKQIGIFSDQGYISEIVEDRSFCFLQDPYRLPVLCHTFFNKPLTWAYAFLDHYLQSFSFTYLFIQGSQDIYLTLPGYGEFFLSLAPFYLWGIYLLIKNPSPYHRLILGIILIVPIPSALASWPHPVRLATLAPFVVLLVAFGLAALLRFRSRLLIGLLVCLLSLQAIRYYLNYFYVYPVQYDTAAYPLPNSLGNFLSKEAANYDQIYFGSIGPGLHMFVAYNVAYPPALYQVDVVWPPPDPIGFTHPKTLGKYHFGTIPLDEVYQQAGPKTLYIGDSSESRQPSSILTNFSGVHTQVKIYDIDFLRDLETRMATASATAN